MRRRPLPGGESPRHHAGAAQHHQPREQLLSEDPRRGAEVDTAGSAMMIITYRKLFASPQRIRCCNGNGFQVCVTVPLWERCGHYDHTLKKANVGKADGIARERNAHLGINQDRGLLGVWQRCYVKMRYLADLERPETDKQ